MKRLWLVLFMMLGLLVVVPTPTVFAQYDNTNTVLGQLDAYYTLDPVLNKGETNGIPVPNAYNFNSYLGGEVYDSTRHRLFVADRNNNRVLVYDADVSDNLPFGDEPDYVLGQPDFVTRTATTSQTGLSSPSDLTLDEAGGRLFVADTGNGRVMVFDVSGAITSGMNAANYLGGGANFNTATLANTSYATATLNQFNSPQGLAYDTDTSYLYVSDNTKKRVTIFDVAAITNGESALAAVLGDASGNFSLNGPKKMAIDTTNNRMFLADTNKHRVLVYDIATLVLQEDPVNVLGQPDFVTVTSGTTQSKMFSPVTIAYKQSTNQLAVGMNYRVLIYDVAAISNGENATNVLGKANFTSTSNGVSSLSTLFTVDGISWVGSSQLMVLGRNRLLSYDVTSITDGEAATNVLGQIDPEGNIVTTSILPNGNNTNAYGFDYAQDVKVDTTNNRLYVADRFNYRILVFNLDATTKLPLDNQADYVLGAPDFTTFATPTGNAATFEPIGMAVDETNGRLFVVDDYYNRVLVFDVNTITNGENATNVLGQDDFATADNDTTSTRFNAPSHLAYNSTDDWLFVADSNNYRVLLFDLSGGITDGMAASKVIGQPDFITSNCDTTVNTFCNLEGSLVFDETNRNLYVADSYNYRVMVHNIPATLGAMSNFQNASYVINQTDFTSFDSTPVTSRMSDVYGLALSSGGMLLVNDCYNYRIFAYDVSTLSNNVSPIGVIGQSDFSGISQPAISANSMDCDNSQGMDYDDVGQRLYLADVANNRIVVYDIAKITTATLPDGDTDSSYSQAVSTSQVNGTGSVALGTGSLPNGLSFSDPNLTGTPTLAGSYDFSLRITDDSGSVGSFFSTQDYSVTITSGGPPPTPSPSPSPSPSPELYGNTSTVLGQIDSYVSTDPVDTTNYKNSTSIPNAYNFDSNLGSSVFDETRHRLFVADKNNNRILVYDTDVSNTIPYGQAPDAVIGQPDFTTKTTATTQSGLSAPRGMALDESGGRLFVADNANGRVMVFDVSGAVTSGMNATNFLGGAANFTSTSFASSNYETGNLNAFFDVTGLAYDSDTNFLYVSDAFKKRITIFDVAAITNGETAMSVVLGDASGDYSLNNPYGMVVDTANDRLFVSDLLNSRVLVYDIAALVSLEDPVNVLGQPDFATTTAGTTQSKMFSPQDVAYRSSDNLLAVGLTGGRILIYDVTGISNGENAVNVLGQPDFVTADSTISLAYTGNVNSVEWVGTTKLLALDTYRLLEFDVTTITDGEAATNVLGQVDILGTIKTDTRTANGVFVTAYGLENPAAVKVDTTNNRLYVADKLNYRVLVYNLDNTTKLPVDNQADYVLGQTDFVSDTAPSGYNATSFNPEGLELDLANNLLFVADQNSHRILIFDVSSISNGEAAVNVLGQANFTSGGSATTDSNFDTPYFMSYNQEDKWLFVGDGYNYRVLVFDLSSGISDGMAASKVIGEPNFTTAVCNLTIDGMCDVEGQLAYDATNRNLYVADAYGNRILVYTIPSTLAGFSNGMDANYVIGQSDFVTDDYAPIETRYNNMYGIDITADGMLLIHDCYNYRILAYDVRNLTNDPTPIGVVGQYNFSDVSLLTLGPDTLSSCYGSHGIDFDDTSNRLYYVDTLAHRVIGKDFAKITTTSVADATENTSYSQAFSSSQLNSTGTFSLESGTLPTGLSLTSPTITGTPTSSGSFPFSLRLTDDGGSIGSFFTIQDYSFSVASADASPTPTPSPSATPSPSPSPSPVTAGAPNLSSPGSGSTTSSKPSFSWTAPAEPENVSSYTFLLDGKVLFSNLPASSSQETDDYIYVYDSSNHSYLLQLKNPLSSGSHTWEVQAISTTGQTTSSSSSTFTVGGGSSSTTDTDILTPNASSSGSPRPLTTPPATPYPSETLESVDLREQAVQIIGAFTNFNSVVGQVLGQLKPSAPFVPIALTTAAAAVTAGFVALQVGTQIFNPKIFLEVLRSLGLLAQKPPQGMIFDAATFMPIPFALITLTSQDKSITETVVTDTNGVYRGVKLPVGEYQMLAAHQEYSFPSSKKRPNYLSHRDFYQGEAFTVDSEKYQQLFLIPMDDLLHRARKHSFKASMSHAFSWVLNHQTFITTAMLGLSGLMTYLSPTLLNIVLTGFYGLLMAKKLALLLKAPLVSGVVQGPQNRPLADAIVRFADVSSNELKALARTDQNGTFKAFIDKGTYQVAATKLGYLWQEASMSLNQQTFSKPTKMSVKMQKAEAINLF